MKVVIKNNAEQEKKQLSLRKQKKNDRHKTQLKRKSKTYI